MLTLEQIQAAKKRFEGVIHTTPLEYSKRLSQKYKADIYIKREDLNEVRSYKIRGAYNLMSQLTPEEKKAGVVCASAGNHAQGFAKSCQLLGIQGVVYMPVTTPGQKVYKTKQFGGDKLKVVLIGDTFDQALASAKKYQEETGATFVHPFDDIRTIEGQSTIGFEIHTQLAELGKKADYILCPIGGGGFISGIIEATNALFGTENSPLLQRRGAGGEGGCGIATGDEGCEIIGVEPMGAPSMKTSLEQQENTIVEIQDTFIDGASVGRVGYLPFEICKNYHLEVLLAPENRVCSTIEDFLREEGIVVEPAGALATDGLKDVAKLIEGKTVVVTISGSNFDFERLPEVKERSLKFEELKRYYLVTFPQRPGALKDFLECLGEHDDIERFEYLKKSAKATAPVFIGLKTDSKDNWVGIEQKMLKLGFKHKNVTNDELYFQLLV